ncbi:hypothetical protein [Amycolatopsis pigmentata]|uniref:Uncharacterized protein n=1 Tax=Amycolatopsis pigmentata TaxID=450801 RepID=A0ABW5FZS5_9PSEU
MMIFGTAWATIGITSLGSPPGSRSVVLGIFMLIIAALVALQGGLNEQLGRITQEAGVRHQL